MRTIKVYDLERHKNHRDAPSGCYGTYYRISPTVGMKLLNVEPYKSVKDLIQSRHWRTAYKEYHLLKDAQKSGFTPKPYRVVAVKYLEEDSIEPGYRYQPGIMMQHINGDEGDDYVSLEAATRVAKKLERLTGLIHDDFNGHNVKVEYYSTGKVKKYWLIDFSPDVTRRTK